MPRTTEAETPSATIELLERQLAAAKNNTEGLREEQKLIGENARLDWEILGAEEVRLGFEKLRDLTRIDNMALTRNTMLAARQRLTISVLESFKNDKPLSGDDVAFGLRFLLCLALEHEIKQGTKPQIQDQFNTVHKLQEQKIAIENQLLAVRRKIATGAK